MRAAVVILGVLACADARAENTQTMTLAEAYQLALKASERVELAKASVVDADIEHRAAWNEMTPAITGTAQGAFQQEVKINNAPFQQDHQLIAGASIVQPIFRRDFFAQRTAGEHAIDAANASLSREREQLAKDVADAYIEVVRTRAIRELERAAVDRTVALRDNTTGRVKAGGALHTAELLAQLDVQRAQRQLVSSERDVGVAEATFLRLVGRSPPAKLELPAVPAMTDKAKALSAARQRTDIKALELRVQEAESQVDASNGRRFWPKLDVTATSNYYSPETFGPRSVDWRVLGVLTIPFLQNGNEYTDIALKENAARVAALELEQQRKVVVNEVQVAAVEVDTSAHTFELADQQLKTARENYNLVEKQFKLGAVTFLEVSNAEVVLSEAENAFESARADRVRAVFDYLFAVGALTGEFR